MLNKNSYDVTEHSNLENQLFQWAWISILTGIVLSMMVFGLILGIILIFLGGILGIVGTGIWLFRLSNNGFIK